MIKKGSSLLEVLLTLCILSSLMLVTLSYNHSLNLDHLNFMNEYERKKCDSLIYHSDSYALKGVTFNSNGNVNRANTLKFNNHTITIHLGNGYVTYE